MKVAVVLFWFLLLIAIIFSTFFLMSIAGSQWLALSIMFSGVFTFFVVFAVGIDALD